MAFSAQELQDAGKIALDFHMKKSPIDQVAVERPFMKSLMGKKKSFPGGKQYIVEQLRYRYQSNFQWFNGASVVSYNKRVTVEQAQFPWRSAHDGFSLDEDRLAQNGIVIDDNGKGGNASQAEQVQLTNLLTESTETLRLGFEEKFSMYLHLDGTSSTDAVAGLDAIVALDPTSGTVGGIDRSTSTYWRNNVSTSLTAPTTASQAATFLAAMETMWRACVKNGGRPDLIFAGASFIDAYIASLTLSGQQIQYAGGEARKLDGGVGGVYFKGIEIQWCPEFDDNFGGFVSPSTGWTKRCYFINSKHLTLRPMDGQDMVTRKPPRVYDKYVYYWALTWRGSLTTNRANAHAVLALS
ncbi:phage major capsid protein [Quatrionicoccus australiensis]|uniref:phage major capsid protein n=1 Tax=Quatrionicoccus australiensis TaxID=138118 RepID=UPI001CFAC8C0|nr:phage major capsid protein [Quatrionicoccus australiensis]MCB4358429.1 phage major capsid protein [Quatrionicoccus australiensis]